MTLEISTAFSHDWLNGMRGGEKCLEALCELYPASPIHTLFYEKGRVSDVIAARRIHTSWLQHFPKIFTHYRNYLPFFSSAVESLNLKDFDLVVSTSHCVAKGVKKAPDALHVCYCFTPVRYAWGFFDEYFGNKNFILKYLIRFFVERLKKWDLRSNERVDHFIAISRHVKERIERHYKRSAEVIYPPVDTDFYAPDPAVKREDFYLVVSALVPYKRVDLAIRVFNRLHRKLVIIGDGPEKAALQKLAGKNTVFLGWQSNEILRDYYRRARALVFPGEEDFGIVPVEMQACGGFVIAFAQGGALETVFAGKTGILFDEPAEASLESAIMNFETHSLNSDAARENACRFSRERFKSEIKEAIDRFVESKRIDLSS